MKPDLSQLCIAPIRSIREAIAAIDKNGEGIVLLVNGERHLLGTITDGDIRRAILAGTDLDLPLQHLLDQRTDTPITALVGTPNVALLEMMRRYVLRHIPLVNEEKQVMGVALLSDLINVPDLPLSAVIMAGGYGKRLHPLTKKLPKPMLPIGDRPLLQRIIERLREAGVRQMHVTTYYKGEMITQYFGNGQNFGVNIDYVKEQRPLGTAGALSLLDVPKNPMLIINGDILTNLDFRAMLDFHGEHNADMTVAVRLYEFQIPYGVTETEGYQVKKIVEKPVLQRFINAGIYLLNPAVWHLIPSGRPSNMTDLVERLITENYRVAAFPVREYWQDIGQRQDYDKAVAAVKNGEV